MTVGIAGLGLIGGSIGLALRKPGREVIGYDPAPESGKLALERQCVDRVVSLEELGSAEAIFVAAPPSQVVPLAEQLLSIVSEEIPISDCASVKGDIAEWAKRRKVAQFVPGHPMAGHEKSGAGFSSAWLFRHAKWILTPLPSTSRPALHKIETLVKEMGGTPMRMNAATHDRQVAILSHLPHAFAALLVQLGQELESTEIASGSWRDLTRVGGVDPELWTQIFLGNQKEFTRILADAEGRLSYLRSAVESGDAAAVKTFMQEAADAKAKFEPKTVKPPGAPRRTIGKRRP